MYSKLIAFILVLAAIAPTYAANCSVNIQAGSEMKFTPNVTVDKVCKTFTLTNTGYVPKQAMGHSIVASKVSDTSSIAPYTAGNPSLMNAISRVIRSL